MSAQEKILVTQSRFYSLVMSQAEQTAGRFWMQTFLFLFWKRWFIQHIFFCSITQKMKRLTFGEFRVTLETAVGTLSFLKDSNLTSVTAKPPLYSVIIDLTINYWLLMSAHDIEIKSVCFDHFIRSCYTCWKVLGRLSRTRTTESLFVMILGGAPLRRWLLMLKMIFQAVVCSLLATIWGMLFLLFMTVLLCTKPGPWGHGSPGFGVEEVDWSAWSPYLGLPAGISGRPPLMLFSDRQMGQNFRHTSCSYSKDWVPDSFIWKH